MASKKMPHSGHDKHLCYLQNVGYVDAHLDEYKELVKKPKFLCKGCGRAAASDANLCKPEKL
jgi:hypothetical protein